MSRHVLGDEGLLTLTIKMRVSPEPGSGQELTNLMRRYREALNYAIKVVIENKALSLGRAHKLLLQGSNHSCKILAEKSEERKDSKGKNPEALANPRTKLQSQRLLH